MTLRLPFSWQKTRFSMYCVEQFGQLRVVDKRATNTLATHFLQFWLCLRHLGQADVCSAVWQGWKNAVALEFGPPEKGCSRIDNSDKSSRSFHQLRLSAKAVGIAFSLFITSSDRNQNEFEVCKSQKAAEGRWRRLGGGGWRRCTRCVYNTSIYYISRKAPRIKANSKASRTCCEAAC